MMTTGGEIAVGTSSSRYLDVGSITFTNSNKGSVDDVFTIYNNIERETIL